MLYVCVAGRWQFCVVDGSVRLWAVWIDMVLIRMRSLQTADYVDGAVGECL